MMDDRRQLDAERPKPRISHTQVGSRAAAWIDRQTSSSILGVGVGFRLHVSPTPHFARDTGHGTPDMADDATAATAEDAPAVRPSSSLDEILGQIDSTLAAGAPEPEPEPEPSGTTPPVPVPVPVPPTLDDDLNALLAATGLDGGGSGDGNGNDGGVDDAFDDIFGPSTSVGTQQGPPPPASSQGAGGTGSGAAPAVASASASASESTAWKNFGAWGGVWN